MRIAITAALIGATFAAAHVAPGSLSVKGGETFPAGQKVTVSWSADVNNDHGRASWTLWLSKNNGADWEVIQSGIPGATSNTIVSHEWTVPANPTTQAKIRAHQSGYDKNPPSNSGNAYTLVSATFTIASTTAITAPSTSPAAASAAIAREGEFIAIRFVATEARLASVEVYDLSGALQKNLELSAVKAGENQFKVSAKELGLTGKSILRLRIGNRVLLEELIGAQ